MWIAEDSMLGSEFILTKMTTIAFFPLGYANQYAIMS